MLRPSFCQAFSVPVAASNLVVLSLSVALRTSSLTVPLLQTDQEVFDRPAGFR